MLAECVAAAAARLLEHRVQLTRKRIIRPDEAIPTFHARTVSIRSDSLGGGRMPNRVTGLNEVLGNLHATVDGISQATVDAVYDTAYAGAHRASELAPRVTGRLAESFIDGRSERDSLGPGGVRTGVDKHGPFAEIGSRVEYAAKIEYTDKPMLRPAAHQMETELVEITHEKVVRSMSRRIR